MHSYLQRNGCCHAVTQTSRRHHRPSLTLPRLSLLALAVLAAVSGMAAETPATPRTETTLPEVKVTDSANSATEGSGLYTTRAISIGKTTQAPREIPQSVSVITRQQLDDRNFTKLEDVIKFTTGMNVTRFDGAGNFNSIQSRGFDVGAIQLDGIPINQGANYATALDAFLYDRIEVLRGPAGLLQGGGEPGGAINLVRKRALGEFAVNSSLSAGSFDFARAEVDVTGPLNSSGSVRGRLLALHDERDSHIVVLDNRKWLGYGTVEVDLAPGTTLSLGHARQEVRSGYDRGLPARPNGELLDLPISFAVLLRGTRHDLDTRDTFAELETQTAGGGQVKLAARQVKRDLFYKFADSNSALRPDGTVAMSNGELFSAQEDTNLDAYYTGPWQWLGRKHRVVVGVSRNSSDAYGGNFALGPALTFNVFAPDYDRPFPAVTLPGHQTLTERKETAAYGQVQFSATDRLKLLAGGRLSWAKVETTRLRDGVVTARAEPGRQFTPLVATLYDLNSALTAYASYAETFVVQTQLDRAGGLLTPRTGNQIEFGIKGEFLNRRLQTHLAVFRIDDENRAVADPDVITASIAGGEVRSQGFEAEASGQVAPGWDVLAGYAYTDTEFLKAPIAQQGQVFSTVTPRHSLNLYSRYAFRDAALRGLSIGGGLAYRSEFYAQSGTVRLVTGDYTLFNAQLGYQINNQLSLNLSVDNLFDKKYYEKVSSPTRQNFYGEPRRVALVLKASY